MITTGTVSAAKVIAEVCANVVRGNDVLVIVDHSRFQIGQAFVEANRLIGASAALVMIESEWNRLPNTLAKALQEAHVVFIATEKSLTHTRAVQIAKALGSRIISMPGISQEILERCGEVDYERLNRITHDLAEKVTKANNLRITSDLGTDFLTPIRGKALAQTGLCPRKVFKSRGETMWRGCLQNIPSGEVAVVPRGYECGGTIVFDGTVGSIGKLQNPVILKADKGRVISIEGKTEAEMLRTIIQKADKNANCVAEVGVGTNDKVLLSGNILEDEKKLGTAHIALGDNVNLGGTIASDIHIDGIIMSPTILLDETPIVEKGKSMFKDM